MPKNAINIRFTPDELVRVDAAAQFMKLKRSTFCRNATMSVTDLDRANLNIFMQGPSYKKSSEEISGPEILRAFQKLDGAEKKRLIQVMFDIWMEEPAIKI